MTSIPRLLPHACFALLVASAPANAAAPGARPGDQDMTCEAVAAERAAIEDAIARRGDEQAKAARRREGVMNFAKGAVGAAAPAMLGRLSGGSMGGAIAAQSASQGLSQAMSQPGSAAPAAAPLAAKPEEQARLGRLVKIAAYRQCPAA